MGCTQSTIPHRRLHELFALTGLTCKWASTLTTFPHELDVTYEYEPLSDAAVGLMVSASVAEPEIAPPSEAANHLSASEMQTNRAR